MANIIPSGIIDQIIHFANFTDKIPDTVFRTILGFILTIVLIYLAGLLLSVVGKRFFNKIEENIFYNIPIFRTIYKTIKQIIDSISSPSKNSFKKVVMVELNQQHLGRHLKFEMFILTILST